MTAEVTRLRIEWQVSEEEWEQARRACHEHAAGSDYDASGTPRYDLLYGPLQIAHENRSLFRGSQEAAFDGVKVGLLDFAAELAQAVREGRLTADGDERPVDFTLLEHRVTFRFSRSGDEMVVTCDEASATPLRAPVEPVVAGVEAFLRDFVTAVRRQAPGVLDWNSVSVLKSF